MNREALISPHIPKFSIKSSTRENKRARMTTRKGRYNEWNDVCLRSTVFRVWRISRRLKGHCISAGSCGCLAQDLWSGWENDGYLLRRLLKSGRQGVSHQRSVYRTPMLHRQKPQELRGMLGEGMSASGAGTIGVGRCPPNRSNSVSCRFRYICTPILQSSRAIGCSKKQKIKHSAIPDRQLAKLSLVWHAYQKESKNREMGNDGKWLFVAGGTSFAMPGCSINVWSIERAKEDRPWK